MGCKVKLVTGRKIVPEHEPELEKLRAKGITVLANYELKAIVGEKGWRRWWLKRTESRKKFRFRLYLFSARFRAHLFSPRPGCRLDQKQCLLVDRNQRTNLEGVYAAGDVTCGSLQVASAVGEGCVAAMQALAYLRK